MTHARAYIVIDANGMVAGTGYRPAGVASHALAWTGTAAPYVIYARDDGAAFFGLLGEATDPEFHDDGFSPDYAQPWQGAGQPAQTLTQDARNPPGDRRPIAKAG